MSAKMTRTEMRDAGRQAGKSGFLKASTPELVASFKNGDDNPKGRAGAYASDYMANQKIRSGAFFDDYVEGFIDEWRKAFNELPETIAARNVQRLRWKIDNNLSANASISKFLKSFEEDPLYAFEWAEGCIDAVARRFAAQAMLEILDHENGGYEAAMKYARQQTFRAARWPKRSTSPLSNYVEQTKGSAFAEYVDDEM